MIIALTLIIAAITIVTGLSYFEFRRLRKAIYVVFDDIQEIMQAIDTVAYNEQNPEDLTDDYR